MLLQSGIGHTDEGFRNAQQAILADVSGIFSLAQQFGTLIFQPRKTAFHPPYTDFGTDFLAAQGGLFAYIGTGRERKSQLHTQAVHCLPGVQIAAGAKRRDVLYAVTQKQVSCPARNMKNQRLRFKQLALPCCKKRGGNMSLLMGCLHQRNPAGQRKGGGCIQTSQKAGHVRAFYRARPGAYANGCDGRKICLFRNLSQQLRQSDRMVEQCITLPQTHLPGFYRQKLFAITNNLSGVCVKHGQRGCIIACINAKRQHCSALSSRSRATAPSRPLTN